MGKFHVGGRVFCPKAGRIFGLPAQGQNRFFLFWKKRKVAVLDSEKRKKVDRRKSAAISTHSGGFLTATQTTFCAVATKNILTSGNFRCPSRRLGGAAPPPEPQSRTRQAFPIGRYSPKGYAVFSGSGAGEAILILHISRKQNRQWFFWGSRGPIFLQKEAPGKEKLNNKESVLPPPRRKWCS